MTIKNFTHIPNVLFDYHLPKLSGSEIKILFIICRQTYGWKLPSGKRKAKDRISYSQFENKTGLSRRIITNAVDSLIDQNIIRASDRHGNLLYSKNQRKGKTCIYYTPLLQSSAKKDNTQCTFEHYPVQKGNITKENKTKETRQKHFKQGTKRISDAERLRQIKQSKTA